MTLSFGVKLMGLEKNRTVLQRLKKRYSHNKSMVPSCSPEEFGHHLLGARPELVDWLWLRIHNKIPDSRNWVTYGTATLVHPTSEIILAFAEGGFYALRLSPDSRKIALAEGATRKASICGSVVDLSDLQEDWVIGLGENDCEDWWQQAFDHASS